MYLYYININIVMEDQKHLFDCLNGGTCIDVFITNDNNYNDAFLKDIWLVYLNKITSNINIDVFRNFFDKFILMIKQNTTANITLMCNFNSKKSNFCILYVGNEQKISVLSIPNEELNIDATNEMLKKMNYDETLNYCYFILVINKKNEE